MAVVTGGISSGPVPLDYQFSFPIPNCNGWPVGTVELSDTVTHAGDVWQMEFEKVSFDYAACLEYILHLVTSSDGKKKVARLQIYEGEHPVVSPTAVFSASGDKCQMESSGVLGDPKGKKVVVEVLRSVEDEPTKARTSAELLSEIGPMVDRLYDTAIHNHLERLKVLCEFALADNLSAKTVVKTFPYLTVCFAKDQNLDKMLAICADYVDCHKAELTTADLLVESVKIQEGNGGQKEQK